MDADGRAPFRTVLWMVVGFSLLVGVGVAVDEGQPLGFLWTLVALVILGVPAIFAAPVVRWVRGRGINGQRTGNPPTVYREGPDESPYHHGA